MGWDGCQSMSDVRALIAEHEVEMAVGKPGTGTWENLPPIPGTHRRKVYTFTAHSARGGEYEQEVLVESRGDPDFPWEVKFIADSPPPVKDWRTCGGCGARVFATIGLCQDCLAACKRG